MNVTTLLGSICSRNGFAALAVIIAGMALMPLNGEAQGEAGKVEGTTRTISIKKSVLPTDAIEIVRFQGVDSEDFLEDFGIEVKNVGKKPIYFMEIVIARRENHIANTGGLTLEFGPRRLFKIGALAQFDDKSIKPGETVVLKIRPDVVKGYKAAIKEGTWTRDAFDTLFVWFQFLNYGDGTGYELNLNVDKRSKSE